jgi:alpha-L-fucosidase 2
MFDLHPPFQIDGNLGGAAGISELLVQSTLDEIRLLPALPKRWTGGRMAGVRIRGGATVDLSWRGGELIEARLRSDRSANYRVTCNGRSADVALIAGVPIVLDSTLRVIGR